MSGRLIFINLSIASAHHITMQRIFIIVCVFCCAGIALYSWQNSQTQDLKTVRHKASKLTVEWEEKPRAIVQESQIASVRDPKLLLSVSDQVSLLAVGEAEERGLHYLKSHNGGDTFAHRVAVSPPGNAVSSHGENAPTMLNGSATGVLWQESAANKETNILWARSTSWGNSFQKPVRLNDSDVPGQAYFGHVAAMANGTLVAAWLDSRPVAVSKTDSIGDTASIYCTSSTDGGVSWSRNVLVSTNVCACCRPTVVGATDGTVLIAWRHVYLGTEKRHIRDIACARSTDGGRHWGEAIRVAVDNWEIYGCPHTGPHLVRSGHFILASWYSNGAKKEGSEAGIRLSWTRDGGRNWAKPRIMSQGVLDAAEPSLEAIPGGALLTFKARDSQEAGGWGATRPYLVDIRTTGASREPQSLPPQLVPGGRDVSRPVAVADGNGRIWVAWAQSGDQGSQVMMLRGRRI